MVVKLDTKKIDDILTRGVGEFIDPDGTFRKKLESNPEKIIIKFGIDPTRPDIHIGHAVILHKLRQFQDLGCKIVFLIGDFTAQIGDPSGKNKTRPEINMEEIITNANTYLKQIGLILDTADKNKYKLLLNSVWYQSVADYPTGSMTEKSKKWEKDRKRYADIRSDHALPSVTLWNLMSTLRRITHAQLIERDMFKKRIDSGEELYMHEMMYPVLQGTDSYCIAGFFGSCDLEVGGTDQTFNMLMARPIMKANKQEPQAVLAFKLLEGTDGKEKMSKSLDNYIGIADEPNDMYGKVMSIPDSSIVNYFELCTFTPLSEVEEIKKKIKKGSVNPKDLKMSLAKQIVSIYHGEKKAKIAEENFVNTFSKKEIPKDVQEIEGDGKLLEIFVPNKLTNSISEARRLLEAGAVTDMTNNKKLIAKDKFISGHTYKIGKHKFIKIK
jgi:tyrosyl-tRNA synthetase